MRDKKDLLRTIGVLAAIALCVKLFGLLATAIIIAILVVILYLIDEKR